jgi:hypothetical protein
MSITIRLNPVRVITLSETESGIELRHRSGPAALQALFFTAFVVFMIVGTINVWPQFRNGGGSWSPPLDRLPVSGKMAVLSLCLAGSFIICLSALVRAWHTLATGRVWHFDVLQRRVTRNGKRMADFSEIREILVEGDFRGDTDTLALLAVTAAGKRVEITSGTAGEDQFESFVDAARRIFERTSLPYRTVALPAYEPWVKLPDWWNSVS